MSRPVGALLLMVADLAICAMKFRRVLSDTGIFSKLACVTITASQLPVAIRLNNLARLLASKSSLPATRIFAVGYSMSSSEENCASM